MACESSSWSYWRIIWNDGSGTVSWYDLGADYPFGEGVYQLELWGEPNGAVINYRATRLDDAGAEPVIGVIDANLPSGSTTLAMRAEINTGGADSTAAVLDVLRLYAELDFQ